MKLVDTLSLRGLLGRLPRLLPPSQQQQAGRSSSYLWPQHHGYYPRAKRNGASGSKSKAPQKPSGGRDGRGDSGVGPGEGAEQVPGTVGHGWGPTGQKDRSGLSHSHYSSERLSRCLVLRYPGSWSWILRLYAYA